MNEQIMKAMGFDKELKKVAQNKCPFCGASVSIDDFKDELSRREFRISGMCQKCMDKMFG